MVISLCHRFFCTTNLFYTDRPEIKYYNMHVSLEGNIGAGKSSIINKISQRYNIVCHAEPITQWQKVPYVYQQGYFNLLEQIYLHPKTFTFPFQIYAFYTLLQQRNKVLSHHPDGIVIFERSLLTSTLFAKIHHDLGNINSYEYGIYCNVIHGNYADYIPDLMIYLDVDVNQALTRIHHRDRTEEGKCTLNLLEAIKIAHDTYMSSVVESPLVRGKVPRVVKIPANGSEEDVERRVMTAIREIYSCTDISGMATKACPLE